MPISPGNPRAALPSREAVLFETCGFAQERRAAMHMAQCASCVRSSTRESSEKELAASCEPSARPANDLNAASERAAVGDVPKEASAHRVGQITASLLQWRGRPATKSVPQPHTAIRGKCAAEDHYGPRQHTGTLRHARAMTNGQFCEGCAAAAFGFRFRSRNSNMACSARCASSPWNPCPAFSRVSSSTATSAACMRS